MQGAWGVRKKEGENGGMDGENEGEIGGGNYWGKGEGGRREKEEVKKEKKGDRGRKGERRGNKKEK